MADDPADATDDTMLKAVGERLRTLRKAVQMSQYDLADAAGITQAAIWRAEKGLANLNLRSLSRLALALGTTMSNILDGIAADPGTLGTRTYTWREGKDPRTEPGKRKAADRASAEKAIRKSSS